MFLGEKERGGAPAKKREREREGSLAAGGSPESKRSREAGGFGSLVSVSRAGCTCDPSKGRRERRRRLIFKCAAARTDHRSRISLSLSLSLSSTSSLAPLFLWRARLAPAHSNGRSLDNAARSRNPAAEYIHYTYIYLSELLCNTSVADYRGSLSLSAYIPASALCLQRCRPDCLCTLVPEKFRVCAGIHLAMTFPSCR